MTNVRQLPIVVLQQRVEVNILQIHCEVNHSVFALPSQVPGQYLTAREVAFLFNINERTVRKWACKGRLKRYFFGRHPFYKLHELFLN